MTLTTHRQGTAEWLDARLEGIGSSDAPVICGESPYRGPYALWAEKTGRVPAAEPDERTARLYRIGHIMEPVLIGLYEEETGRKTRREHRMLKHRTWPWMLTSLDARVIGLQPRRIVECKWTNARRWQTEEVPGDVLIQVQHAMEVADAEVADVVALVGSDLRIVEVERDRALMQNIMALEERFWRNVTEDVEPPPDGSESARRALGALRPRDNGVEMIATPDMEDVGVALLTAKAKAKQIEEEIGGLENTLRYLIGEASAVEGAAFRATYKKNSDSTRVAWAEYAGGLEQLVPEEKQEDADTLKAIHTNIVPGPRVLRITDRRMKG